MNGFALQRSISALTSTYTPLNNGQTYTSAVEECPLEFSSVSVAIYSDQHCTYYMQFSVDGTNWDSSIPLKYYAGIAEAPKRFNIYRKYFRLVIVNDSGSNQTVLRAQVIYGNFPITNSSLGSVVNQDADTIITRNSFDKKAIALGLFENTSIVYKAGFNRDIDTGSVPEDVNEGGGVYLGYPSTGDTVRAVSTSASDASAGTGLRTMSASLMLESTRQWVTVNFTLNGLTPVAPDAPYTNTNFIRGHTASGQTAGSGGKNAGDVSIYQTNTPTNIFLIMPIGRNQTNNSTYTVPEGYTALLTNLKMYVAQSTTSSFARGCLYVRSGSTGLFRERRPLIAQTSFPAEDLTEEYLSIPQNSDIIGRVLESSSNNLQVIFKYFIYLVKN